MPCPPRRSLLALAASCLGGCACGEAPVEPPLPPPNVLIVTLDTTRQDALGCYGSPLGATPNLDAVAREGVRFTNAYTVTPLTIPAHSSLFTGVLPPRHGVRDNGDFFLDDGATTLAECLSEAGYDTMASVGAEVTSHHWGFSQGFDAYYDSMEAAGPTRDRWRIERPAGEVVDDAVEWLSRPERAGAPWFAWVHLFDAHHPYAAPEAHAVAFAGFPYLAEVHYADAEVGRLLEGLREDGRLDRTWVFLVADHGEGLGDHGETMHGVLLYNATTRIPLIVRPPTPLPAERVVTEPVSLVDLMPTVLAIAGAARPPILDGLDLGPALSGERGDLAPFLARPVFVESLYGWRHYGWAPQHALVDPLFKVIDSTTPEIYSLSDRYEENDLAATLPTRVEAISREIDDLLAEMEPLGAATARAELSTERVSQLEALGYVTSTTGVEATEGLPDPVRELPTLRDIEQIRQSLQAGDLEAARKRAEALIEANPTLLPPREILAQVLDRSGETEAALAMARELDGMQSSTQTRTLIGSLLARSGRREEAVQVLSAVLETDPYLEPAWVIYLPLLAMAGDPRYADELFRARALLPDSPPILAMEGELLLARGDPSAAEPLLVNALARNPRIPRVNLALATIREASGDPVRAEAYYEAELALAEDSIPALRGLAALQASQGRHEAQLATLERLLAAEGPNGPTLHAIAQALYNLGRYPESYETLIECREIAPEYPACAMLEANALAKLGREAEAREAYTRALELGERATGIPMKAP